MSNYPDWLDYSQENGLRDLDVAFGRFLFDINKKNDLSLLLAVLTSYQLINGNPCLNLNAILANPLDFVPPLWADNQTKFNSWAELLKTDQQMILNHLYQTVYIGDEQEFKPLNLVGNNLYLHRYWLAAKNIIDSINVLFDTNYINEQNFQIYQKLLATVFNDGSSGDKTNWQKIACAIALNKQFAIITGGPGTGKTTTVVRLLCVLQAIAIENGYANGLQISLAAPTGKAAARLNESINNALATLDFAGHDLLSRALQLVPNQARTLHSLLGVRFSSRFFIHNETNPLDLDVLVIDEASMMDIEMFDAVFKALPSQARLIVLGDKDQLSSVEAGAIMGELCARSAQANYPETYASFIADLTGEKIPQNLINNNGTRLDQAIAMLRQSYRFHKDTGIGKLAAAINSSDSKTLNRILQQPDSDLEFIKPELANHNWTSILFQKNAYPALFSYIKNHYPGQNADTAAWDEYAQHVLKIQTSLQILCAVRKGPWGTESINKLIENRLKANAFIQQPIGEWYAGRPVMVLRNRPDLGLANGDIGVALSVPDRFDSNKQNIRVAFIDSNNTNSVLWLSPARLDQVETVYALTVHKSQGSEFERVLLVLPDQFSPVLTKELLYTGVTRAKKYLGLLLPGGVKSLEIAIKNPTKRSKALITERIL